MGAIKYYSELSSSSSSSSSSTRSSSTVSKSSINQVRYWISNIKQKRISVKFNCKSNNYLVQAVLNQSLKRLKEQRAKLRSEEELNTRSFIPNYTAEKEDIITAELPDLAELLPDLDDFMNQLSNVSRNKPTTDVTTMTNS